MTQKIMRQGQKRCPKCNAWVRGTRTKTCPKCGHQFNGKQEVASAAETAVVTEEKPTKAGDMVSLEQVKAVARTVKAIGGFHRLNELLDLIRELGGLKKFKDLLEAISVSQVDDIKF